MALSGDRLARLCSCCSLVWCVKPQLCVPTRKPSRGRLPRCDCDGTRAAHHGRARRGDTCRLRHSLSFVGTVMHAPPSRLRATPPTTAAALSARGNLSPSHLRQTYLQSFRLVSPADAAYVPTAEATQRPPLIEPLIRSANEATARRAAKSLQAEERRRRHEAAKKYAWETQHQQRATNLVANTQPLNAIYYGSQPQTHYAYAHTASPFPAYPHTALAADPRNLNHIARPYTSPVGHYMQGHELHFPSAPPMTTMVPFDEKESHARTLPPISDARSQRSSVTAPAGQMQHLGETTPATSHHRKHSVASVGDDAGHSSLDSALVPVAAASEAASPPTPATTTLVQQQPTVASPSPPPPRESVNPAQEWIVRRNGALTVRSPSPSPRSSRQYTIRRNAGADLLGNLTFPRPALTHAPQASPVIAPAVVTPQSIKNKEMIARAASILSPTAPTSIVAPPPRQPPARTIFDEDDDAVDIFADDDYIVGATPPPFEPAVVGFRPATEDLMDLYFLLTDEACPIFRQTSAQAARAASQAAIEAAAAVPMTPAPAKKWNPWEEDFSTPLAALPSASAALSSPTQGFAAAPAQPPSSAALLATRVGIDLPRLSDLRSAAGGSVLAALGYLQALCPVERASTILSSSTSSRLASCFDPFRTMDELIHTVRTMRERDAAAGIPPPDYTRRDQQPSTTSVTSSALRTSRDLDAPRSFHPLQSSAPRPDEWPVKSERDLEADVQRVAQQLLGFAPHSARATPPNESNDR